ncbi:hypothetical protein J2T16_001632 [Paenibacillus intestini]|nr:hypothetical protein [Paenibacillus intestini]
MEKDSKGTDQGKRESDEMSSGFHPVYMVEFLFNEKPDVNRHVLQEALIHRTGQGRLDVKQEEKEQGTQEMMVFYHMEHKVSFQEGSIPAQTCLLPVHEIVDRTRFAGALQQAWHWPEAGQAIASARYSIRIHDMFTAAMPRKQRLDLFQKTVLAVQDTLDCDALYWYGSDKLVEPDAYIQSQEREEHLYAAMNVRMYQAGGTEQQRELVMDTVGLSALGVPDVQCHFTGLDPDTVAQTLLGAAYYIFDQGDVLQDGQTLGSSGGQRWRCEHQFALIAPGRYVVDLNPGEEHAVPAPQTVR